MTSRYSLSVAFCLLLIIVALGASNTHAAADTQPATHRIIVKFKAGALPAAGDKRHGQVLRLGNSLSLRHLRTLGDSSRVYTLGRFQKLGEVKAVAAELMRRDDVEYAEPDLRRYPQFVPNDADYSNQWYLHETAGGINAEPAWDITFGDSSVVIALIDSGILPHNDLVRVLQGYDFISEDPPGEPDPYFTANDDNGRENDPADPGDWVDADECEDGSPAENSSWHGTKLAGIVAAQTNNGSGIAGIDQQAWVLPVRALGRCGGYLSDIADAIRWAAGLSVPGVPDNATPADVINLSLGAAGVCSNTERQAIDAAVANGTVVVVAAGNEGGFISDSAPANCENVITVTATTRQGAETCYTNIGTGADLAAPGGNSQEDFCTASLNDQIYLLSNAGTDAPAAGDNFFDYGAGTSFSAAMVTGAVALIRSVNSSLSPQNIETLLKNTARAFPTVATDGFRPCTPDNCGAGILDLQAAIAAAANAPPDAPPTPIGNSGGGGGSLWGLLVLAGISGLSKLRHRRKRA